MASRDTAEKARALREEQARKDRKTRNIIIGVVLVFLLIVGAGIGYVVWTGSAGKGGGAGGVAEKYSAGEPMVIGKPGSGKPVVQEFMDYTCSHCADMDAVVGQQLTAAAVEGKIVLEIHPVRTVDYPFNAVATAAALRISVAQPEKLAEFHHAAMAYFLTQAEKKDGAVVADATKSVAVVKELAATLGIGEDVLKDLSADEAGTYLDNSSKNWESAKIQGLDPKKLGTPMFVRDNKVVELAIPDNIKTITERDDWLVKEYLPKLIG